MGSACPQHALRAQRGERRRGPPQARDSFAVKVSHWGCQPSAERQVPACICSPAPRTSRGCQETPAARRVASCIGRPPAQGWLGAPLHVDELTCHLVPPGNKTTETLNAWACFRHSLRSFPQKPEGRNSCANGRSMSEVREGARQLPRVRHQGSQERPQTVTQASTTKPQRKCTKLPGNAGTIDAEQWGRRGRAPS